MIITLFHHSSHIIILLHLFNGIRFLYRIADLSLSRYLPKNIYTISPQCLFTRARTVYRDSICVLYLHTSLPVHCTVLSCTPLHKTSRHHFSFPSAIGFYYFSDPKLVLRQLLSYACGSFLKLCIFPFYNVECQWL